MPLIRTHLMGPRGGSALLTLRRHLSPLIMLRDASAIGRMHDVWSGADG